MLCIYDMQRALKALLSCFGDMNVKYVLFIRNIFGQIMKLSLYHRFFRLFHRKVLRVYRIVKISLYSRNDRVHTEPGKPIK